MRLARLKRLTPFSRSMAGVLWLVALMGLLAPSTVLAQGVEPRSGRAALEAFTKDLERFGADFEQIIISADGAVMEEGAGEVWMQRPDRFRWSYLGEFPELIVADGERVWMYDESLEQVTVREQGELGGDSPLLVIMDLSILDERFTVTELGTVTGLHLIELIARDPEAQFERLVLGFQGETLQRLVLEDAFGLRTELRFTELRRNPEIPEGHFEFEPPPGVDLIGDVPAG
jgi:outer membrane lipoprotein carrier protein